MTIIVVYGVETNKNISNSKIPLDIMICNSIIYGFPVYCCIVVFEKDISKVKKYVNYVNKKEEKAKYKIEDFCRLHHIQEKPKWQLVYFPDNIKIPTYGFTIS